MGRKLGYNEWITKQIKLKFEYESIFPNMHVLYEFTFYLTLISEILYISFKFFSRKTCGNMTESWDQLK